MAKWRVAAISGDTVFLKPDLTRASNITMLTDAMTAIPEGKRVVIDLTEHDRTGPEIVDLLRRLPTRFEGEIYLSQKIKASLDLFCMGSATLMSSEAQDTIGGNIKVVVGSPSEVPVFPKDDLYSFVDTIVRAQKDSSVGSASSKVIFVPGQGSTLRAEILSQAEGCYTCIDGPDGVQVSIHTPLSSTSAAKEFFKEMAKRLPIDRPCHLDLSNLGLPMGTVSTDICTLLNARKKLLEGLPSDSVKHLLVITIQKKFASFFPNNRASSFGYEIKTVE